MCTFRSQGGRTGERRGWNGWKGVGCSAVVSADARAVMVLMAKPAIEAGGQVTVEWGRVTALDPCGSLVNAKRVSTTPLRTCV